MKEARLNVQGLARRDKGFASCIVAEGGRVLVGMDLGAGEPTCTAHYSRDPMYRYATLDGIGKEPHFNADGVLMIDDIYLMTMSTTPIGRPHILAAWEQDWSGKTFVRQWMEKSKVIKSALEDQRQLHKMVALALGYGMGTAKMQKQVYEQFGVQMDLADCKGIYNGYWRTFKGVKALVKRCQEQAAKGFIVNDFGYRMTFIATGNRDLSRGPLDTTHKAYNALIQSSVSGIMHVFNMFLFEECDKAAIDARFVTVIHDETVADVLTSQLEAFDAARQRATDRLNDYLKWSVPVRVGFTPGPDFYSIK